MVIIYEKSYKVLLILIATVYIFIASFGKQFELLPPIYQSIYVAFFVVPLCILLILVSKDEKIKKPIRIISIVITVEVIICFIGATVLEFRN